MVAECFSGECGFCDCCTKTNHYVSNGLPNESQVRAQDMKKFFGKEEIQTEFEKYHKSLREQMKSYQYCDKSEPGFCPKKFTFGPSEFTLNNSFDKCDSVLCQMFHLNLHENISKRLLGDIPMYQGQANKSFCILCTRRSHVPLSVAYS